MITIILYVVGGLVGLIALMALIGLTLRPDHKAARQADLPRPAAELYDLIRDVEKHPTWRTDVKKVEILPPRDGKRSFREHSSQGTITFVVDSDDAPTGDGPGRLVTRIADDNLPFGGRWIIEVTPAPAAATARTTVKITEDGFVKNPIFRFLSRTVYSLTATQERYLHALGRHVGAEVTPVPAEPAAS
jgi:hypothetical protein